MTADDIQPIDLSPLVARIDELAITWARFVAWSGDPRLRVDHCPLDWRGYIAGHVLGCVHVSQADAEDLLVQIANE